MNWKEWKLGRWAMSPLEMKEWLCEAIDNTIVAGGANEALWGVYEDRRGVPLFVCVTGNGPESETHALGIITSMALLARAKKAMDAVKDEPMNCSFCYVSNIAGDECKTCSYTKAREDLQDVLDLIEEHFPDIGG